MADTWDEAACRARLAAMTPGPWVIGGLFPTGWRLDRGATPIGQRCHDFVGVFRRESDAIFSAHAAADLGTALAALDAAREEIDRLRARLEECRLVGAADSAAVAESLQLRSERDHWQRKWAEGRDEIDRLRAALTPFAALGAALSDYARDHPDWVVHAAIRYDPYKVEAQITIADCRRAAAALGGDSDG
jgi:hypothetical protein